MESIISIIIAYLGYSVTGYDFFVLLTLISLSIEIYKDSIKALKRFHKNTKDKTARWQIRHFWTKRIPHNPQITQYFQHTNDFVIVYLSTAAITYLLYQLTFYASNIINRKFRHILNYQYSVVYMIIIYLINNVVNIYFIVFVIFCCL